MPARSVHVRFGAVACRALRAASIGAVLLGAVLLTTAPAAAQDEDCGLPCEGVITAGNLPLYVPPAEGGTAVANIDPNTGEITFVPDIAPGTIVAAPGFDPNVAIQENPGYIDVAAAEDSDGDGLYDWDELNVYGTDPYNVDTDGDTMTDGYEVYIGSDPLTYHPPLN